jgi:hypothetical protein
LAARCSYFNSLFSHGWIENGNNVNGMLALTLPWSADVFSVIIHYLYTLQLQVR